MNKTLIIVLLYLVSLTTVQAGMSFEEMYGIPASNYYDVIADQIVSARFQGSELSLQEQYARLKSLQLKIEIKAGDYSDEPLVWFLSGLNLNNLAEIRYLLVLDKSGQKKATTDSDVINHNIARSRAYSNAIRFDSEQPHQLSSSIYATMGYGLTNKQKIKTYTRELELGSPSENESNEWFMHWAKIDALIHEKKLNEAQAALNELKNLLENEDKAASPYAEIVEKAESQVDTFTAESQKRQASKQKTETLNVESDDTGESWGWKTWLISLFGVVTFIAVLFVALYKRNQ